MGFKPIAMKLKDIILVLSPALVGVVTNKHQV